MPTAPDRIAVIAMQLARTDRRALSQAWYDSLHVARTADASRGVAGRVTTNASTAQVRTLRPPEARPSPAHPAAFRRRSIEAAARPHALEPDVAVTKLRRAITTLASPSRSVAQTISLGSARVRLIVRTDAAGTRVVAICTAADRERVGRALAQVRVSLAAAGVTLAA